MALTSLTIPSSLASSRAEDIFKEYNGLCRSHSSNRLCKRASIRRSYSDIHLCYCVNPIHATLTQPEPKNSRSMGISSFQIPGSIIPKLLRSYSFGPDSSKHMNVVENDMNMVENSGESSEREEIKKNNWVESLVELRNNWRNIWQQKEVAGEDNDCDGHGDGDGEMRYRSYDRELFSRFLIRVPWSDTKLFSQLSFLCNMAYVIPEIKVCFC